MQRLPWAVRRGMGASRAVARPRRSPKNPIPTPALPLKGRESKATEMKVLPLMSPALPLKGRASKVT